MHFDDSLVKAVALQSWWKYTGKSKLAEKFNLTEDQMDRLRKTPVYRDKVLNLMVGQRPREDFEKWLERYGPSMEERFGRRMGLKPKVVSVMIKEARQFYADIAAGERQAPKAIFNPAKFDTSSEVKKLGTGGEAVYLYYFPTYRRIAELLDQPYWPCKIGKAKDDPVHRVSQQIGDQHPEKARIALILWTQDCQTLEDDIHNVLKRDGRQIEDAIGTEWFLTHPSEVSAIYRSLLGGDR